MGEGEGDSGSSSSQGEGPVVSFKINRKSEAASVLKSSIASKLPDFLSDYSDEVLAVSHSEISSIKSNQIHFRCLFSIDSFLFCV